MISITFTKLFIALLQKRKAVDTIGETRRRCATGDDDLRRRRQTKRFNNNVGITRRLDYGGKEEEEDNMWRRSKIFCLLSLLSLGFMGCA